MNPKKQPEPAPAKPYWDSLDRKKVLAMTLHDSDEFVTIPFGKFWNTMVEDHCGIWPEGMFLERFDPLKN